MGDKKTEKISSFIQNLCNNLQHHEIGNGIGSTDVKGFSGRSRNFQNTDKIPDDIPNCDGLTLIQGPAWDWENGKRTDQMLNDLIRGTARSYYD